VRFVRKHQLVHADKKAPTRPPASYLVYLTTTFKGPHWTRTQIAGATKITPRRKIPLHCQYGCGATAVGPQNAPGRVQTAQADELARPEARHGSGGCAAEPADRSGRCSFGLWGLLQSAGKPPGCERRPPPCPLNCRS